ncbi:uncharacterized protein LOC114308182 [Camellia sinensis]|uniref:uncharacterized protein LOC114308182 n=1 Tax=Camellia sinensis TaxID=4442 RepID=UPI00103681A9|nr:uncharacterized protein LOC114308182 [Camellia sinensis]
MTIFTSFSKLISHIMAETSSIINQLEGGGAFCNWQMIQVSHIAKVTFNKTVFLLVVDVEERLVEDVPNNTPYFMAFRLEEFFRKLYILSDLVEQSLLVTGFGYEHDDAWSTNIELFKEFTDASQGVRRLGAAAVDICHVALGIVEAYWEYRLKPWDMAAAFYFMAKYGSQGWMILLSPFLGQTNGYLTVCALTSAPKGYKVR